MQFFVTVTATNSLLTSTRSCLVSVVDVNDAPVIASASFEIEESNAFGLTQLGNVIATDEDSGNAPCIELIFVLFLLWQSHLL